MKALFYALFLISFCASAQGDPDFKKSAVTDTSGRIKEVTITGAVHGAKSPVLFFDKADVAYEKGIANTTFSKYLPEMPITKTETLYDTKAPWGNVDGTFFIHRDLSESRYKEAGAYYFSPYHDESLSTPRVHNKDTPYAATAEPKKLYVSWWLKQQNDSRDMFTVQLDTVSTDFKPVEGDEFVVQVEKDWTGITEIRGRVAAYSSLTKMLSANFYGQRNANKFDKRPLVLENGGTALIAKVVTWQGSNKYIRVWESDGADEAMRMSWTNTEIYAGDMRGLPYSSVIPRQWNHMELFIDQTKNTVKTKVNSRPDFEGVYSGDEDRIGFAPAIGLIGFDSTVEMPQKIWLDDIYMDSSFQRVTLADAENSADITHEEVQFYTKWTDSEIVFEPNYGNLDRKKPIYIYVYSNDNVSNSKGVILQSPIEIKER
jgi:hypothetical protein